MIAIKPSHRGLLHREMGISEDKPISLGSLARAKSKAKKSGDVKREKQVVFAENARNWHH